MQLKAIKENEIINYLDKEKFEIWQNIHQDLSGSFLEFFQLHCNDLNYGIIFVAKSPDVNSLTVKLLIIKEINTQEFLEIKKLICCCLKKYNIGYASFWFDDKLPQIDYYDRHLRMIRTYTNNIKNIENTGLEIIENYSDREQIIALHEKSFDKKAYTSLNWRLFFANSDFTTSNKYNVAVINDNRLIGIVLCSLLEDYNRIVTVAIDPLFKGKGIGRLLLTKVFEKYNNKDFMLGVYENNYSAINLYKSLGFEVVKINSLIWKIE